VFEELLAVLLSSAKFVCELESMLWTAVGREYEYNDREDEDGRDGFRGSSGR